MEDNTCPQCGAPLDLEQQVSAVKARMRAVRAENAALHLALFHVENGLAHPDKDIRQLIQAALLVKAGATEL